MKKFRIFKQVPRIIFGKQSLFRLQELLPDNVGYRCFVVDDFHGQKFLEEKIRNLMKEQDHIEWFPASKNEPKTTQVD
jgi:3-deoxy-alpha-D-manno-octulosonate 8-oxidase